MNIRIRRFSVFLLLATSLCAVPGVRAESPEQFVTKIESESDFLQQAPVYSELSFPVIVFRDVGWTEPEVTRVIREASHIYARECQFTLNVTGIRFVDVSSRLHHLDNRMQEQLLAQLDDIDRPLVFFIGTTSGHDAAYAYLLGTASPSQGTAWLTRQVTKQCRGPLLAHEIGHIALEASHHSRQPGNLMQNSCRSSNISNQSAGTSLNHKQCQMLWDRYAQ